MSSDLFPGLFDHFLCRQMFDYVWGRRESNEDNWDQEIIKVLFQQIEGLWRWNSGNEQIEAIDQHEARALQATRCGKDSLNLGDCLIII